MAFRVAVLSLALSIASLAAGCAREARIGARAGEACLSCHEPHHRGEGTCRDCHRGNATVLRQALAHDRLLTGGAAATLLADRRIVNQGATLVEGAACRRCHRVAGAGNRLATDLDAAVWQRDQPDLRTSILTPVVNMPAFRFDATQADAIIAFLLRNRSTALSPAAYRVQFSSRPSRAITAFETRCGPCHRALSGSGPLGTGAQGPNLSGLLTHFYPPTAPGGLPWSAQSVRHWLHNPRAVRPTTTMPPPLPEPAELTALIQQLTDERRN